MHLSGKEDAGWFPKKPRNRGKGQKPHKDPEHHDYGNSNGTQPTNNGKRYGPAPGYGRELDPKRTRKVELEPERQE